MPKLFPHDKLPRRCHFDYPFFAPTLAARTPYEFGVKV